MNTTNTCNLTSKDHYGTMLSDCRAALESLRAPEAAIQEYLDRVAGILDDLAQHMCPRGAPIIDGAFLLIHRKRAYEHRPFAG